MYDAVQAPAEHRARCFLWQRSAISGCWQSQRSDRTWLVPVGACRRRDSDRSPCKFARALYGVTLSPVQLAYGMSNAVASKDKIDTLMCTRQHACTCDCNHGCTVTVQVALYQVSADTPDHSTGRIEKGVKWLTFTLECVCCELAAAAGCCRLATHAPHKTAQA